MTPFFEKSVRFLSGNRLGSARAAQGNRRYDGFASRFRVDYGVGHVRGHPAGRYTVHQNVVARELGGEALTEADNPAFRGAVVGVKRFAALPGGGADRNNLSGFLLDHLRHGKMNDGVDAR